MSIGLLSNRGIEEDSRGGNVVVDGVELLARRPLHLAAEVVEQVVAINEGILVLLVESKGLVDIYMSYS